MPTAAEREILGYLIETGFIDDRLVAIAQQVLAGCALSHEEQAAFRQGIAEKWFGLGLRAMQLCGGNQGYPSRDRIWRCTVPALPLSGRRCRNVEPADPRGFGRAAIHGRSREARVHREGRPAIYL